MSQPPSGPYPHGSSGEPGRPDQPTPGPGPWNAPQAPGQPPGGPGGTPPGQQPGGGQPGPYGQSGPYQPPVSYGPPGQQSSYGQPGPYGQQGAYGQPGQQGSYGQPGQYGQQGPYASYGQPGPYGPPGGPGGSGQGGGRRGLVIGLVAAVVLVVALGAVLLFTLRDDPAPAASASSATSSSASTSRSSPSSSSAAPSSSAPAARDRDFVATLPTDLTGCQPIDLHGDGDVAAARCGPALTQPGPQEAQFHLYEDVATLDEVFVRDVESRGIAAFPGDPDCATGQGSGEWSSSSSTGRFACALIDGRPWLYWTDHVALTEGILIGPGSTQADLGTLYDWWTTNSDYVL